MNKVDKALRAEALSKVLPLIAAARAEVERGSEEGNLLLLAYKLVTDEVEFWGEVAR